MTRPIRGASALLVSAIALATIASTAVAGAPSDRQVLATAPPGASLTVGDIDAARDTVAVVWHEQRDAGPRSFLRFGDDDGSFGPREALGGTRNAVDPRVAICEFLWTSVTRKTRSGPRGSWRLGRRRHRSYSNRTASGTLGTARGQTSPAATVASRWPGSTRPARRRT